MLNKAFFQLFLIIDSDQLANSGGCHKLKLPHQKPKINVAKPHKSDVDFYVFHGIIKGDIVIRR